METVSDDDLVQLYRRSILIAGPHRDDASWPRKRSAARRSPQRIPPADAYRRLIAAEDDDDRALALIHEARERSEAAGESTASLGPRRIGAAHRERQSRAGAGDARADRADASRRSAGGGGRVSVALRNRRHFARGGGGQHPSSCRAAAARAFGSRRTGGAGSAGSRIWTPDSDRPAGGGKKSSLWTPS